MVPLCWGVISFEWRYKLWVIRQGNPISKGRWSLTIEFEHLDALWRKCNSKCSCERNCWPARWLVEERLPCYRQIFFWEMANRSRLFGHGFWDIPVKKKQLNMKFLYLNMIRPPQNQLWENIKFGEFLGTLDTQNHWIKFLSPKSLWKKSCISRSVARFARAPYCLETALWSLARANFAESHKSTKFSLWDVFWKTCTVSVARGKNHLRKTL